MQTSKDTLQHANQISGDVGAFLTELQNVQQFVQRHQEALFGDAGTEATAVSGLFDHSASEHVDSGVHVQVSGIYDHFEFLRSAAQSPQSPLSSAVPDRNSPQLQVGQQVENYLDSGSVWVQSSEVVMQPTKPQADMTRAKQMLLHAVMAGDADAVAEAQAAMVEAEAAQEELELSVVMLKDEVPDGQSPPLDTFLTELRSVQQFVEQHQVALFGAGAEAKTVSKQHVVILYALNTSAS